MSLFLFLFYMHSIFKITISIPAFCFHMCVWVCIKEIHFCFKQKMTSLNLLYCFTILSISALVSLPFQIKQINIVNLLWVNSCLKIRNIREKNCSCGKLHWIDYWKGLTFVFFSHINTKATQLQYRLLMLKDFLNQLA